MNIFVVNAGSSSIKSAYFSGPDGPAFKSVWSAEIHWSTLPSHASLHWTSAVQGSGQREIDIDAHGSATAAILAAAVDSAAIAPDAIGHRVVHGLTETRCTFIDARVRALIETAAELAPLHNAAALAGIDAVSTAFPGVRQAAAFDTAFHATLAPAAAAYALPYDWFATRGLRKYGFHGISHRYCAQRTAALLDVDPARLRMVSAHLGNGCSLAAIAGGKSVDTTMGFTPLDGVMMGSRCGGVDPGLVLHLLQTNAYTAADLDRIFNTESGLAGVSAVSEDIRAVIDAAAAGSAQAQLALDMYVRRLSAGIAAMATATGGIDALAFTGGVGENSGYVRGRVCAQLAFLGVDLAETANIAGDREIGAPGAAIRVAIIPAREEYAIARDVAELIA